MNDEDDSDLEVLEPIDEIDSSNPTDPIDRTPRSGLPRRRVWLLLAGAAGVAAIAAVFVSLGSHEARRRTTASSEAATPAPVTSTSVPSFGPDPFGVANGRFAVVVDGRLWIVDAGSRAVRGVTGLGRVQILAVSGSSVLVGSEVPEGSGARYIVDGRKGAAVRAVDGTLIPRLGGGWWIADSHGLTSGTHRVVPPPDGIVLAQVNGGFVVAPASGAAPILWDPRSGSTRALGPAPHTRMLGGDANRIALADPHCAGLARPRCSIAIVDVASGRSRSVPVPFADQFVRSAVFSADGSRMAIWGTRGVSLIDTSSGAVEKTLTAARLATTPLTFTADSSALLVLEAPQPYRQVVVLRADTGRFERTWVSEQQLEQIVALAN
jgi:hypothetical protein